MGAKRLLSFVPQRVAHPGLLTGRELLSFFARLKGAEAKRVDELLARFSLAEDAGRFTREYSGGMLQRLGLAIAFLVPVPLYVFDEPSLNLDPQGMTLLRELLSERKAEGATILFASHVLQHALDLADRAAVLAEGRLLRIEPVRVLEEQIAANVGVRVVLRETSARMLDAAVEAGARRVKCNGTQLSFFASAARRLGVIHAIESAGGQIAEFHTEAPDWSVLTASERAGEETP